MTSPIKTMDDGMNALPVTAKIIAVVGFPIFMATILMAFVLAQTAGWVAQDTPTSKYQATARTERLEFQKTILNMQQQVLKLTQEMIVHARNQSVQTELLRFDCVQRNKHNDDGMRKCLSPLSSN